MSLFQSFIILSSLGICISAYAQPKYLGRATREEMKEYLSEYVDSVNLIDPGFTLDKKYSERECQNDLIILIAAISDASAPYNRSLNPIRDSVYNLFIDALKKTEGGMTYLEFVRTIAPMFNTLGCIHSSWGHSTSYKQFRKKEMVFFPFSVKIINGGMYIYENYSRQAKLKMGSVILEINSTPTKDIIDTLKQYVIGDGENELQREWLVQDFFSNAYSNFIDNPSEFELKYIPYRSNHIEWTTVKALKKSEIDSLKKLRYPSKPAPLPLEMEYIDSIETGIFTIHWFNKEYIKYKGQDFEAFTDSVFEVLQTKNAKNLVIDIRNNPGGWTAYGMYLFSYFISKPTNYISSVYFNRMPPKLGEYNSKVGDYFFEPLWINKGLYKDTFEFSYIKGFHIWDNYPNQIAHPAPRNRFAGNTIILVNPGTASCGSVFSALMNENTDATFIGQECGGAVQGQNGMVAMFKLPHTRIGISLSTGIYKNYVKNTDNRHGVIPDHSPKIDMDDIIYKRDVVKEYTIRYISDQHKKK